MRVKWLGTASFEVETNGLVIHVDPHLIPHTGQKADLVLLTHHHLTHADEKGIIGVKKKETFAVSTDHAAEKLDLNASIVNIGENVLYKDIVATAVPAYVDDSMHHQRGHGVGYVIESSGKKIYHTGVTRYVPEMSLLEEVNLMVLPIGVHNMMSDKEIVSIAQKVNPEILAPIYYGLGEESSAYLDQTKLMVESSSNTRVIDLRLSELHL